MPTDRAHLRLAWVRQQLQRPDLQLESASSDASFRSYWRTKGLDPALIVMDAPPPQEDLGTWLDIGQCLARAGTHVPRVHASERKLGFALIEDLGQRMYLDALNEASADQLYSDAMQALLNMQMHVDSTCLAVYDSEFLRQELELLEPWFLGKHLGHTPSATEWSILAEAFDILIDSACEQPTCFVHRDFHSRNLMLTDHDSPGVIDFQGALHGPITYDLVSLLRDCYVRWDEAKVARWSEDYRLRLLDSGLLSRPVGSQEFARGFDLMGLQRHIKVLGLFCRLALRDGKHGYLADLPLVLGYVLDITARYPELRGLHSLLADCTAGRDLTGIRPGSTGAITCAP